MAEALKEFVQGQVSETGVLYDTGKQVISSLSHELRTPLAILNSNIQMLKEVYGNSGNQQIKETCHLCEEAIRSMTRLADDIALLNSANKGMLKAKYQSFDLEKFIGDLMHAIPVHDSDKIRIRLRKNLVAKRVTTDPGLLNAIFQNLLQNALKFSADTVIFEVFSAREFLTVQVTDYGVGVREEETDYLFEPFFRGSNVKMIAGCGLGLAVVKQCLNLLRGEIEIITFHNPQATLFRVKIPLAPGSPNAKNKSSGRHSFINTVKQRNFL